MRRLIAGILAPVLVIAGFYLWGRTHPYTVTTSIDIAVPADRVWAVLTDIETYHKWNPELTGVSGRLAEGGRLTVHMRSASGAETIHPVVQAAAPGRELTWLGHFRDVRHLADGEHRFAIATTGPGRVRFTQSETFRGIAVPFIRGTLHGQCSTFDAMNAVLKTRAESGE